MAKAKKDQGEKKEKKLTIQQVKNRVELFLGELEFAFDYQNWDRRVVYEKEDKDNCAAEVNTELAYRRLTVRIYPAYFTHSPRDQRLFLLHELCHSYTDKIYQLALSLLNGKFETAETLRLANEEATSRITDFIDCLLRSRMRYTRVAYARYLDPKKK